VNIIKSVKDKSKQISIFTIGDQPNINNVKDKSKQISIFTIGDQPNINNVKDNKYPCHFANGNQLTCLNHNAVSAKISSETDPTPSFCFNLFYFRKVRISFHRSPFC
jgi:hypothetical protein